MSPTFYTPVRPSGSPEDRKALEAAAIPCWLFRLRAFGMKLPPTNVPMLQGAAVCIAPEAEQDRFSMRFYEQGEWKRWHLELTSARLVKESGGVWHFGGDEFNADVKRTYQQAWLCTPDEATGRAILARMPWPPA